MMELKISVLARALALRVKFFSAFLVFQVTNQVFHLYVVISSSLCYGLS